MEDRPPFDSDDDLDFDFDEPRRRYWEREADTGERRREPEPAEPALEPPSPDPDGPPDREETRHGGTPYEEQPSTGDRPAYRDDPSSAEIPSYEEPSTGTGEFDDPFDTAERRARRERRHHRDLPAKVRRRQFIGIAVIALVVLVVGFLLVKGLFGGDDEGGEEPLAVKKLLGQSFVAPVGNNPSQALLKAARKGQIGGVIVSSAAGNVTEEGVRNGVATLQQAAADGGNPPLLVMIDQEGEPVKRLPGPPTASHAELGEAGDPEGAQTAGSDTGAYLRGLGVTVDLAPVLDVTLTRTADTIADRTFGDDPALVSELGSAWIEGLQSQRVAATAKHFPGLGLATVNTDFAPVTVVGREEEIDAALQPFQTAIDAGVQLVMMSSAAYPDLAGATPNQGKVKPAVFAEPIVQGLLRQELGFQGVIITDDLESIAIKELTNRDVAAVSALQAGNDLVLYARTETGLRQGFAAAVKAFKAGNIDQAQLEAANERIQTLKEALAAS